MKIKTKSIVNSSMARIEKGKCLIVKPIWLDSSPIQLDSRLGLIVSLLYNDISQIKDTYIRPSTSVKDDRYLEEFVYEFDKKHTEKIKKLEEAYFLKKININACAMCDALAMFQDKLGDLLKKKINKKK